MALEPYGIGESGMSRETFETSAEIPQNRVLLAGKLTADDLLKPSLTEGLTDIDKVFDHFNPHLEITFETETGAFQRETLYFRNLNDFSIRHITAQSSYLSGLKMKELQHQKMVKKLQTNQPLQEALKDPGKKQQLLKTMHSLLSELKATH